MESRSMNEHKFWFQIALRNFSAARILQKTKHPHEAAYFAQQAAEKALKGYLISKQIPFKKTHDLNELIDTCFQHNTAFKEFEYQAHFLSPYATRSRYPDSYEPDLTDYQANVLLGHGEDIMNITFKLLQLTLKQK